MTPKEYLSQYGWIERNIRRLEEEKERWRQRALHITPSWSDAPGGSSGEDKVQTAVEKACIIEDKIVAEIDRLIDLRQEIITVIAAVLDPVQRELLERRYIQLQSLERIAVEMNYSYRQILRLHGWALQQISVPEEKMAHHVT